MVSINIERTRIVITGLGAISNAGRTTDQLWESLSAADPNDKTTTERVAGETAPLNGAADFSGHINDFGCLPDQKRKSLRKSLKLMNRETQMGVAAGQLALADSDALDNYEPDRFGICYGADNVSIMPEDFQQGIQACTDSEGQFDVDRWGADGINEVAPLWILKCLPNMPACHLAIINDLRGCNNTITQRDVSANMAIAEACRKIQTDDADAMLVGATGTMLATFNQMHAQIEEEVSGNNHHCCPFDKHRTGSVPGEGAGAVVLEEYHSAIGRGAPIYGEILGATSASAIGSDRVTACRTALTRALRQTLRKARQVPSEIGHIHAHGLGSRESDVSEALAIRDVFGQSAESIPLVAAKSHLANSASGAGLLELIASLLAMKKGALFPIRNFQEADPDCPVQPVTCHDEATGSSFLNLNVFGRGVASCVAVRDLCD